MRLLAPLAPLDLLRPGLRLRRLHLLALLGLLPRGPRLRRLLPLVLSGLLRQSDPLQLAKCNPEKCPAHPLGYPGSPDTKRHHAKQLYPMGNLPLVQMAVPLLSLRQ